MYSNINIKNRILTATNSDTHFDCIRPKPKPKSVDIGFLRPNDRWCRQRDHHIFFFQIAKSYCLTLKSPILTKFEPNLHRVFRFALVI